MSTTMAPAEAFPPGEYLRDELAERGWTAAELAQILGRPVQVVSEILNARKEITAETATEIARALGTTAGLWLNLQSAYRLAQVRQDSAHLGDVDRRARLRNLVPLAEIRRLVWIDAGEDIDAAEEAVRRFLGVASLDDTPASRSSPGESTMASPSVLRSSHGSVGCVRSPRAWRSPDST